ncbi:MAG: hypothetical protein QXV21_04720 [Candidatus Bathyarchaeia archaeon]
MRKEALLLILLVIPLLLAVVHANNIETITAWTNKQVYVPSERGTLYVNFYNSGASTVEIKNITVTYKSWQAYIDGKWVGNETFSVNENVTSGSVITLAVPFTIPSDGRAQTTTVDIEIRTNIGLETKVNALSINVSETSPYMEQIVTLFTIQAVLLIVCTIVISATIFLSMHKPPSAIKTSKSQGEY